MNTWTLIRRGLWHYRRTHAGVVAGAAVAVAVLVGAMFVGDSVSYTLRRTAKMRLGRVEMAIHTPQRFFRAALADDLNGSLGAEVAPVLALRGFAVRRDGTARAGRVNVLGVDERFWRLGAATAPLSKSNSAGTKCVLNVPLAERLSLVSGQEILLRIEKPSLLPRDVPLAGDSDSIIRVPLVIAAVAGEQDFGRFSLRANQLAPLNVFVPLDWLAEKVSLAGRANMLLVGDFPHKGDSARVIDSALSKAWTLDDAGVELREIPAVGALELRSRRVFLDQPIAAAAMKASTSARGVFTYFVNELRLGERATPYSFVAGVEELPRSGSAPRPLKDEEILIGKWLADDLQASTGDTIELRYYVVSPSRRLVERTKRLRVRTDDPPQDDPTLMPEFPGLSDAENCRDWRTGIEIDLDRIRPKDEKYWQRRRGTPKAFVTLPAAQAMWGNRFGNLTAVRYPLIAGAREKVAAGIRDELDPASIGLFFKPVRKTADAAAGEALDFRMLFLGFSFFLIVAAVILMGLLFALGMQQRSQEVGTLLALGLGAARVRRMLLMEGLLLAAAGTALGLGASVLYTRMMLSGLQRLWPEVVANSAVTFHASIGTLVIGGFSGIVVAASVIWIISLRQARRPARQLLAAANSGDLIASGGRPRRATWLAAISAGGALVVMVSAGAGVGTKAAGAFFGAGALLLIASIAAAAAFLSRLSTRADARNLSLGALSVKNAVRRKGRSVSVIALLACGVFLVISVGANRQNPLAGASKRSSGTGGYALWAEASTGVFGDLNSPGGRKHYRLSDEEMRGVSFLPMRVIEGDDASCLNLNRPQRPTLLGVDPKPLADRKAFTFTAVTQRSEASPWMLLDSKLPDEEIPAIGDEDTIVWALGKKLGDTLDYVDERGRTFRIRIVAQLASSVFQGSLLIGEKNFRKRFPSLSGRRVFLIDALPQRAGEVARTLSRRMAKVGLSVTTTAGRLAMFTAVVNTYLSIFQVLGSLGVGLGSVGLGTIVLRNVLERRGELALLRAVGMSRGRLFRLVFVEHLLLVVLGVLCGALAGVVAVVPALRSPGAQVPYGSLTLTLAAIATGGALWTLLATGLALRGQLLPALRDE